MPRTLPWLTRASASTANRTASTFVAKRRRLNAQDAEDAEDAPNNSGSRERNFKRMDTFAPPNVEYMLNSDEFYIMVEDELHDIAHQFTRSLHRAEYQRLQALAASKNASRISEIQRPTTGPGPLPKDHLTELERIARRKEQEKLLKDVPLVKEEDGLNSDEEEKERMSQWQGTNLGALMLSPGQRKRDLSTKWTMKATTRAAAGFHRGKSDLGSQRPTAKTAKGDSDIDESMVPKRLFTSGSTRGKLAALAVSARAKPKPRIDEPPHIKKEHSGTYEDDDLDAPISKTVPQASAPRHPHHCCSTIKLENQRSTALQLKSHHSSPPVPLTKPSASSAVVKPPSKRPVAASVDLSVFDDLLSLPPPKSNTLGAGGYKGKAMAALAKKREMEKKL